MSLIQYIEPMNAGSLFVGLGSLILVLLACVIIWRFFKPILGLIELFYNKESRYEIIEEKLLNDYAMEKGINLDEEMIKREIINKRKPSIRRKIEDELFKKLFPEEKKE